MDIAGAIKDYQTLLASIIALSAALIAYNSAQKVAQSAKSTALELAERTRIQSNTERLSQERRLRLAILLELRSDIDAFRRLHALRIKFAEMLCAGPHFENADQIDFARYALAFASLKLTIGRLDDLLIIKIGTSDMSLLDMQTQRNIHFFAFSILLAENNFTNLSIDLSARNNKFILGIEIVNLQSALETATRAEEHVRLFLDSKLQQIGDEPAS